MVQYRFEIEINSQIRGLRKLEHALTQSATLTLNQIPKAVLRKKLWETRKPFLLSIALVTSKTIQILNSTYRLKNKPTDVLSFSRLEGSKSPYPEIGDVILCLKVAKEQAKTAGCSIQEETCRLLVHGMLHLFGYDHERSKKDAKTMFTLQDTILSKITRGWLQSGGAKRLSARGKGSLRRSSLPKRNK